MADESNLTAVDDSEKAEIAKKEKSDKDSKAAKKKGPGKGSGFKKFFKDTKGEFKKIIWPTKETTFRDTGATLLMCVIIGLFVALFDLGLSALIKLMMSLS